MTTVPITSDDGSVSIDFPQLTIPEFKLGPCNIMPTKQDIANSLMQLASIPSKILVMAEIMVNEELQQAAEDLQAILDEIEGILGPCAPNWETVDIPERKWEVIVDCLIREYPMFVINKILELINKLISVDFEIPLPPLPIKIDIIKLLSDPEYKKELKAKFAGVDDATKELIKGKIDELTGLFAGGCTEKTIESGDTLSQIAVDNNTTVDALMKANPTIKDANVIKAGDSLSITGTGESCSPGILEMTIADMIDTEKLAVIDAFYDLLPAEAKAFGGEFGTEITEFKAEAVWAWIQIQMSSGGMGLLFTLFDKLIGVFDKIWKALGLPDLPIPLTTDIGAMIQAIVDAEKAAFLAEVDKIKDDIDDFDKVELIDKLSETMAGNMIEQLESIKLGPFSLADFCGGIDEDFVCSENKMRRCKESLAELKANYQLWLIKKWMEIVSKFLKAIGLGKIMEMVTFDFCDFLKIMGVPEKISPPDLLLGLGMIAVGGDRKSVSDKVGDASKFKFTSAETAAMDAVKLLPMYTAAANQTVFSGVDDDGNILSYSAGSTQVFKTGVSLEDNVLNETDTEDDSNFIQMENEDLLTLEPTQYTAAQETIDIITEDNFNIITDTDTDDFVLLEDRFVLLEDGGILLYEDDNNIILDDAGMVIYEDNYIILLLEDDGLALYEDDNNIILDDDYNALLLEDNGIVLYEDDNDIILENTREGIGKHIILNDEGDKDNLILEETIGSSISLTEAAEEGDIIFIVPLAA